jgi:hypothetical protein
MVRPSIARAAVRELAAARAARELTDRLLDRTQTESVRNTRGASAEQPTTVLTKPPGLAAASLATGHNTLTIRDGTTWRYRNISR